MLYTLKAKTHGSELLAEAEVAAASTRSAEIALLGVQSISAPAFAGQLGSRAVNRVSTAGGADGKAGVASVAQSCSSAAWTFASNRSN